MENNSLQRTFPCLLEVIQSTRQPVAPKPVTGSLLSWPLLTKGIATP